MRFLRVLLLTAAMLLGGGLVCMAQDAPPQDAPSQEPSLGQHRPLPEEKSPLEKQQEAEMRKAREKQRYEEMKRDSEKLLQLATELKQYVDRAGENVLSLEVIRKAEELEKLAHDVKNKMRE